ncbi:MAG: hypothetical protein KGN78_04820 [Actinomycetales bacterium]|nr:hypothetical protein [Actinomycetales bacterium]
MLNRQNIVVPLAQGVDTKSDPKQVEAGKLLELENGVFTKLRSIQKRDGTVSLGQSVLGGTGATISNGVGLATYGTELLEADGERLYSYDNANDGWIDKAAYVPALVTASSVCKDTYNQTHADGVTSVGGLQAYAWEDSQTAGSVRYAIIDGETRQTVVPSTLLSSQASKPRVLTSDTHFLIYYVNTGLNALMLAQIPLSAPLAAPVITQLTAFGASDSALSSSSANYDACLYDVSSAQRLVLIAFNNANAQTTVRLYNLFFPATQVFQDVIPYISRSICVFPANTSSAGTQAPAVVYSTDSGSAPYTQTIQFTAYSPSWMSSTSGVIATGLEYQQARAITAVNNQPDGTIGFDVFYADCDTYPALTNKAVVDYTYTVTSNSLWQRRVAPVGKAFRYNEHTYVPVVFFQPSVTDDFSISGPNGYSVFGTIPLQSCYFLMDGDGKIVAKAFSGSLAANTPCAYTPSALGQITSFNTTTGVATLATAGDYANFSVGMAVQSRTNGVLDYGILNPSGPGFVNVAYVVGINPAGTVTFSNALGGPAGQGLSDWTIAPFWATSSALSELNVNLVSAPLLPAPSNPVDAEFRFAMIDQVVVQGAITETQTNVSQVTFDLTAPEYAVNHEVLADNLHLSGGILQMYDGAGVVEHNFHLYPVFNARYANPGSIDAGVYNYTVCYEWVDNQGNIHQSQPAPPMQVTLTANGRVTLDIQYLAQTAKVGSRPVQIIVYRTGNAASGFGTIFYRLSSLTAPNLNSTTGTYFSFIDNTPDSALAKVDSSGNITSFAPQLYTQFLSTTAPAEVDSQPAPPTGLVQLHRNRLWVVDSTNPLNLWYSKFTGPSTPVAFNDSYVKTVDPRGGPITALATVDDKLLVFKNNQIFYIVGQGPENTGINNDLSDSILITTDAGCVDPRSIVGSPVGILFKSRKGIYLIDRSLAVQYIGASVEAYNAETITSAVLASKRNQVRFTLGSGITLVYDYFVQQWGVFTNQNAIDSLVWNGDIMLLRSSGKVLRETEGVYTDDGQPIRLKLATSWFSFANVQGFQRVRRAQLLGGWKSEHDLNISVCVDFDDTVIQQITVNPAPVTYFGGSSPYGAGPYGGTFQLYQWRVDLARQKCQAVKFIIEDVPSVTGSGEGVSLSSLAFEVGAKQGLNKVPASQIVS